MAVFVLPDSARYRADSLTTNHYIIPLRTAGITHRPSITRHYPVERPGTKAKARPIPTKFPIKFTQLSRTKYFALILAGLTSTLKVAQVGSKMPKPMPLIVRKRR